MGEVDEARVKSLAAYCAQCDRYYCPGAKSDRLFVDRVPVFPEAGTFRLVGDDRHADAPVRGARRTFAGIIEHSGSKKVLMQFRVKAKNIVV
jgi:hypothetical protein